MTVEWARLSADRIVVATGEGAWVHRSRAEDVADPFADAMTGPGTRDTTRWLLDGAIGAACFGRGPDEAPAPLTPIRWAWRLAGYYLTTEATSRLLPEAAERFRAAGRRPLEQWARLRAEEEKGHDRLARRDIEALGYDAGRVVAQFAPRGAQALVAYFTRAVREAADPIGCVGYAYALERLAAEKHADAVGAVQAMLPPGIHATRCLRVHSAAGSDAAHIAETVETVARLGAPERGAIAVACYETARLFYRRDSRESPTDEELQRLLAPQPPRRTDAQSDQDPRQDRRQTNVRRAQAG